MAISCPHSPNCPTTDQQEQELCPEMLFCLKQSRLPQKEAKKGLLSQSYLAPPGSFPKNGNSPKENVRPSEQRTHPPPPPRKE